ncbi:MAG: carbohydrate ABC transporter permease [Beijerinckiaceae bacterium]
MADTKALQTPLSLKLLTAAFVALWTIVAMFPLFWVAVMSFKQPVDALSSNPLNVIFGPATRNISGGLSVLSLVLGIAVLVALYQAPVRYGQAFAARLAPQGRMAIGWIMAALIYLVGAAVLLFVLLPFVTNLVNAILSPVPLLGLLAKPIIGVTLEHYRAVWVQHEFYRNFINSMMITFGVVTISLSVGTLAAYGLARTKSNLAFWLLIAALVFRALPHSVLVTGYIPVFINSREWLAPLWNAPFTGWFFHLFSANAPSLYGQPLAIIIVLVSINQPFTIWMMRSFFMNIPNELDEAARVDGCTQFGAFWRVIMPVMWPGVITTGLFSFLLAYNDYLVTALLLDAQSQTMVPAISQYLNRDTRLSDQIEAIAAAVSITAPLFLLVMVFQKQIVSGLTAGAVKG